MNVKVLQAIKESAAVPSIPQVVTRFLQIMQDPEFDFDDLKKVLSADPGTVSEVLRLANSALFGIRNKVVSLRQALTLLGPKRTRSVLLGRYLVDSFSRKRVAGLDMSYFWRRSLASSVVASRLAESVVPKCRDEAFIGALLADIGVPILAEALPDLYKPFVERYAPRGKAIEHDEELKEIGVTHAQVSAMVLAHWTLPVPIVKAVNLQHSPTPGNEEFSLVARTLNASDRIARVLCEALETDEAVANCFDAISFVGVSPAVLVDLLPTIESDIEDLADVLRIDVIPSRIYDLIAKAIQAKLSAPVSS